MCSRLSSPPPAVRSAALADDAGIVAGRFRTANCCRAEFSVMPGMSARNSGTGLFRHTWPILITAVARFDFWAGHMLGRQRMARQFFFSLSWGYKGRRFRSSGPPSFLRSDRSGHAHLRAYCSCAPPDQPLLTKPQAPSAALTGIPPNGPGPARYPSGLVFPADRGSLRRRQCADQLRHPRQLRLAGGTAR
jgi:hypothetical protein